MKLDIESFELENLLWLHSELHAQDNGYLEHPLYVVYEKHPQGERMIQPFLTAFMARQFIDRRQSSHHKLEIRVESAADNAEIRFLRQFLMAKRWSEFALPIPPKAESPAPTAAPVQEVLL